MKKILLFSFVFCLGTVGAQTVENLVIITTDGLRWQEVFTGMDPEIASNSSFNQDDSTYIFDTYWSENLKERRSKLFPFLWKVLAPQGRIYGNRGYGNFVNNHNPYWFSYPGYNELLCGFADEKINTNKYPPNPNENLLEFLNKKEMFRGKTAAFGAWNAFDRILNEERSGFPVVCGFDTVPGSLNEAQQLVNKMLAESYKPWMYEECLDVFTHQAAFEYLKARSPKVFYIAYGETDEMAHAGEYRSYLNAARQVDQWIGEIWTYIQSQPQYKNKTALLITVDHGRGDEIKKQWTSHSASIAGADQTWFALVSPTVKPKGEITTSGRLYQDQLAQTLANLLGLAFEANHPVGPAIPLK